MSQRDKLIKAICRNPKDVRFDDACKVAEWLGFTAKERGGTSHCVYARPGEPELLNFQERSNGLIKPYQAKQLVGMIEKYEDEL